MENQLLKLQHILDGVALTKLERAEANANLVQVQKTYQELNGKIEALRTEIQQLKPDKK